MKKVLFLLFMVGSVVALSSCKDNLDDVYDPNYERPHNSFNFSTVTSTTLNVSYANTCMGNKVYFEVYDQNPLLTNGGAPYLNEKLSPLYSGFTDADGKFSAQLNLPSYLSDKTVYVYSPYFFVPTVIEGKLSGTTLSVDDASFSTRAFTRTAAMTRAGSANAKYYSDAVKTDGWKTWLGEYDESTGLITGFNETVTSKKKNYANIIVAFNSKNYKYDSQAINGDEYRSYYYTNSVTNEKVYIQLYYDGNYTTLPDYAHNYNNESMQIKFVDNNKTWYNYTLLSKGLNDYYWYWILYDKTYYKLSELYADYYEVTTEKTTEIVHHNGYEYTGDLRLSKNEASSLYAAHSKVININKACPSDYRASHDMYINEDKTEVTITYLGGNTCWNSSLGYYYYKGNNKPTSLNGKVIMLYPNTQDGLYSLYGRYNVSQSQMYGLRGIAQGTAVQLKFYGENMDQTQGTTEFPAGYRVGFVLATNAWSNHLTADADHTGGFCPYRATTTEGLSIQHSGTPFQTGGQGTSDPRRAAIYKDANKNIVVSFEDHQDDQNYSDVVFAVKSSKEITDIPVVKDEYTTNTITKGVYAFEDLWPTAGDYDMNDVIVRYNTIRTLYTRIKSGFVENTSLVEESFEFKTFQNYATLINGLAVRINSYADNQKDKIQSVKYYKKRPTDADFIDYTNDNKLMQQGTWKNYSKTYTQYQYTSAERPSDDIYLLTDNIANKKNENGIVGDSPDRIGTVYRITFVYSRDSNGDGISANAATDIEPFVTRVHDAKYDGTGGEYDYRLEIHLPDHAASYTSGMLDKGGWAYLHLWGQYDDASSPFRTDNGAINYYYRISHKTTTGKDSALYPFAFFLSGFGTKDEDIDNMKLKKESNESKSIDTVYSGYAKWVESSGAENKTWYLEE